MDVISYIQTLLGNDYGKVKAVCKGGSWLYTPSGRVKICVPKFEVSEDAKPVELPSTLSYDLWEDEVLFVITDRGIINKEGSTYRFYPEGGYRLLWKEGTEPKGNDFSL
jgi:hypothetical protein